MSERYLRLIVLVAGFAQGALAQASRVVSIDSAGMNGLVYLSPMDANARQNFARLFEVPMYQEQQPFALLMTNASDQEIIALTVRWTVTSAGRTGVYDSSTDSLGLQPGSASSMSMPGPGQLRSVSTPAQFGRSWASANGSVVLVSGERMLVTPGMFVREDVTGQRTTPGGGSGLPEPLRNAETVSAALDVVILEDGRVLGLDASHTVDDLRFRKAAIDAVLRAVAMGEQNGQDAVEVLRQLANSRPTREGGPEVIQQSMIARRLMASRLWKEQLQRLSAIQLPNFHRQ